MKTIRALIALDVTLPPEDETLDPAAMTAVYWEALRRMGLAQRVPETASSLPDTWIVTATVQQVAPLARPTFLPSPPAKEKS